MKLERLDAISLPGSPERPNEDACGCAGAFAWVIDGAILPGTAPIMDAPSDAAWLAEFANARFTALAPTTNDGARLILTVIEEARAAFLARVEEVGATARRARHTWPAAALTLVHVRPGEIETFTLADTIAYVRDAEGAMYTLGEAPEARRAESALAARIMRETGTDCETIRKHPAFLADQERRRRAMVESEPAIFGLHPDAVVLADRGTLALDGAVSILLASDGFSALVELYRDTDAAGLMDAALADGLAPLAKRIRVIETELDPSGRLHPRFKRSDDATAILLRAEL